MMKIYLPLLFLISCAHPGFDKSGICYTHKDVHSFDYQLTTIDSEGIVVVMTGGCYDLMGKVKEVMIMEYEGTEI